MRVLGPSSADASGAILGLGKRSRLRSEPGRQESKKSPISKGVLCKGAVRVHNTLGLFLSVTNGDMRWGQLSGYWNWSRYQETSQLLISGSGSAAPLHIRVLFHPQTPSCTHPGQLFPPASMIELSE